jgi:hypothetical protein
LGCAENGVGRLRGGSHGSEYKRKNLLKIISAATRKTGG